MGEYTLKVRLCCKIEIEIVERRHQWNLYNIQWTFCVKRRGCRLQIVKLENPIGKEISNIGNIQRTIQ